jgi:uncharacterized cupredoxin-like copper-binding protein
MEVTMSRTARRLILVPVLALAVGACSASSSPSAPASALAAPTPASSDDSGVVNVTASEYQFEPSTITARPGEVTFRVSNGGSEKHSFEIFKGDQVVDEIEGLGPGVERDLTVTLAAGSYSAVCTLPGHEEAGMMATLTVQSPA